MNEDNGFVLKPEMYSQNEWYQMFLSMLKEFKKMQLENARLKEIENKLKFIKNRAKQGMSQENINKCAIELINSYLKEN